MTPRYLLSLAVGLALSLSAASSAGASPPAWRVPAVVEALGGGSGHALDDLLTACRRAWADAIVTSGFLDWRGVSRYRRVPGQHLGYDVAMPAGTPVACAWPGRVVAVTPWTDSEWGVTVRHDDGTEATYGHLAKPGVTVGATVAPGQTLGLVAVDHLDVKMRDANGRPLDFGAARPSAGITGEWLRARFAVAEAKTRSDGLRLRLAQIDRRLAAPADGGEADERRLRAGLISRKEAARRATARAAVLGERDGLRRDRARVANALRDAEAEAASTAAVLADVERRARRLGVTWRDVERRIAQLLARDAALRAKVAQARTLPVHEPSTAARPTTSAVARYDALYRAGVLSRRGYELATGRRPPDQETVLAD